MPPPDISLTQKEKKTLSRALDGVCGWCECTLYALLQQRGGPQKPRFKRLSRHHEVAVNMIEAMVMIHPTRDGSLTITEERARALFPVLRDYTAAPRWWRGFGDSEHVEQLRVLVEMLRLAAETHR